MCLDIPERGAGPTGSAERARSRLRRLVGGIIARLPAPTPLRQAQRALPWRQLLTQATALWVATRLAYALLTFYFPVVTSGASLSRTPTPLAELIRRWTLWDGQWYIAIARRGYWDFTPTAFFPLYPGAIRLVEAVIGPHWATAALIASNLGSLLAFFGVAALAAQVATPGDERRNARTAITLFAAYPMALFLVAAYSDGLFAGLAALALLCAFRRRWWWAALFGLLTALCRPTAPALLLPIAWEAFQRFRERRGEVAAGQALREIAPMLAALVAPLAGIGAYCAWLWARFGDPLIFVSAEQTWKHMSLSPILSIPLAIYTEATIPFGSPFNTRILLDLAPLLVALVLTLVAARRAPLGFTLYLLALLYLITSEPLNYFDVFVSAGRYLIAAVPLFIIVGQWLKRSEWALPAILWSGALLQAILALWFLQHGWIT